MIREGIQKTSWGAAKQILIIWGSFAILFGIHAIIKHFFYGSGYHVPEKINLPELFLIVAALPFMIFGVAGTVAAVPFWLWGRKKEKREESENSNT